jgi:membrane protein required for colicin V production
LSNSDLLILIVLLASAARGFFKGFILELFTLIGTLAALLFGMTVVHLLLTPLEATFHNAIWVPLLAYILAFSGIYFCVILLARMIETAVKLMQLGILNRLAGAFAGLLKSALLISFIIWTGLRFGLIPSGYPAHSVLYHYIGSMAPHFINLLKSVFPDILNTFPIHRT